ncbi:MAG TPA: metallophosphoesterase [Candidatus Dormibacteraeota bacterium]|nr:metallophosphoesterase [Candidatus Dormibacteraeota bacterium]
MPQIRATIAQISDLHMNRRVDPNVVSMLKHLLANIHPDILVISGDLANQPVPWQMKRAAKLVEEINSLLKCRFTLVIPGNHDFKFWGNIGLRRLSRIPFEIYFRQDGLHQRKIWRLKKSFKLALNALWWNGKEMREPLIRHDEPNLGLVIFAINSNTLTEMMAAGEVIPRDLQELYGQYDKATKENSQFEFLYKIAVVHHHPAPIADAPYDAIARIQDTFMIFYNAGLFVRELSRRGFNLVMHGHKHVAGFLRVQCEFEDLGRTVLPIAAAGTASHPAPDDSRGHHLRVLRIFDDDTAVLEERFFSADIEKKDASCSYELETLDDVRRRRYGAFGRLQKYTVREIQKRVEITTLGFSNVWINHRDCHVVTEQGLAAIPVSLTTARPSYLRGFVENSSTYGSIESDSGSDLYRVSGSFKFATTRKPNDGAFEFGYSYRLMNGHVLTKEEFARHYDGTSQYSEWASVTAHHACDLLTLDVQFPQQYDMAGSEFYAVAEYVPAPLKGPSDERLDRGETKPHEDETKRIARGFRVKGNGVVLSCPQPIPGMIYRLCWKLPGAGGPQPNLSSGAFVEASREKLLKMVGPTNPAGRQLFEHVRSVLEKLANDLNSRLSGPSETFKVTLMVFEKNSRRLKFVATNMGDLPTADFYSGEGCAGYAFEKASSIMYHPERDDIGYFIHPGESGDEGRMEEPVVLLSIPWVHDSQDQQQIVVGVVNISTKLRTTKLLGIFDARDREDKLLSFQALANLWAKQLLFDIMKFGEET